MSRTETPRDPARLRDDPPFGNGNAEALVVDGRECDADAAGENRRQIGQKMVERETRRHLSTRRSTFTPRGPALFGI